MDEGLLFLPVLVFLDFIFIFMVPIQARDDGLIFLPILFGVVPAGVVKAIVFGFLEILIDDGFHVVIFFSPAEIYVVAFGFIYL